MRALTWSDQVHAQLWEASFPRPSESQNSVFRRRVRSRPGHDVPRGSASKKHIVGRDLAFPAGNTGCDHKSSESYRDEIQESLDILSLHNVASKREIAFSFVLKLVGDLGTDDCQVHRCTEGELCPGDSQPNPGTSSLRGFQ
jgi:hypothetical protein